MMVINGFINSWVVAVAFISMLGIFAFCVWSIFTDKVNDGLVGRAFYILTALSAVAWMMHMRDGTYPHRTTTTMIFCIAVLMVRRMFIASQYWARLRCWWRVHVDCARLKNEARRK